MFKIVFTLTFYSLVLYIVDAALPCLTPKDTQGECQSIMKCPSLLSLLSARTVKSEDAAYLRQSQSKCTGFEGHLPIVCCPLGDPLAISASVPKTSSLDTSLLPSLTDCGTGTENKIFGGKGTGLTDYPWMALLHRKNRRGGGNFHCGGVLINSKYVLTAAHCFKPGWTIDSVRLGEYDLTKNPDYDYFKSNTLSAPPVQDILIEEQFVHENYNEFDINQYNDIALVRLSKPANMSDSVKPICLPIHEKDDPRIVVNGNMKVVGWGRTENNTRGSNVKLQVKLPVKSNHDCAATYRIQGVQIGDSQICAGGKVGEDTCSGDSGGPLMSLETYDDGTNINWYVYGLVSYGTSACGIENWPGVYTRVSSYIPWILSKMRP